ncbi:N-methyl-L-tryptophan oxidase [Lichenihabitans sp. Uapishka_5]|uniref:N-methyl-L-tryptophan oxidase n=1 Tax=Lichenihabitans sp. Uapishka_5 TaxID=3037302 RepID=UPI0029E81D2B|nr:N-methyl-L-tryptophan oxidase [Lichenihabitans sp. Uapishka_5]MDX7952600.1 N-methyl-L-tryptophan oxidase [Lichenihabitans sp. Uapishka_5]
MTLFDTAIVGLGAMGSAAAAHLVARGQSVVGFDALYPCNPLGSSHGDSRVIRLGYFEDPAYVPLLRRAYRTWRALERQTGEDLLTVTGVLQIGRPDSPIVSGTRRACEAHDLPFSLLTPAAMAERYPAFRLGEDETGLLEPEGGFLRPERAVAAQIRVAAEGGAVLRFNEKVLDIQPGDGGVTLRSALGSVRARTVIVTTGPWIAQLVPELDGMAVPIRQVVAWYHPQDAFVTALGRMPVFLRDLGPEGSFFGFPALGPDGVKLGRHCHFNEPVDPDLPNPPVTERDTAMLDSFVAGNIPAVAGTVAAAAGQRRATMTCRYTMLPGEDFLVDRHPGEPRIIVASPCSGHGFKFTSVIGEILADLAADGGTALPIDVFSFAALRRAAARA